MGIFIWSKKHRQYGVEKHSLHEDRCRCVSKVSMAVLANGMGNDSLGHCFVASFPGVENLPGESGMKPPYCVPLMSEVSAMPWNGLTVASTFSGAGGSCTGYRMAGFRVKWANEFVPAAQLSYRANASRESVLDPRDIRMVRPEDVMNACGVGVGGLDLFDGSPPCFAAGTPVMTMRGVIPVEQVVAGDMVITHAGRWQKVIATMSRKAPTVMIEGRIESTADHRFYLREQFRMWDNSARSYRWHLDHPEWVSAAAATGKFGATPVAFPVTDPPAVPAGFSYSREFWYMVGRWVGDGWLRLTFGDTPSGLMSRPKPTPSPVPCLNGCGQPSEPNRRIRGAYTHYCSRRCAAAHKRGRRRHPRAEVYVCTGHSDGPDLHVRLTAVGVPVTKSTTGTATRFSISRRSLAEWLLRWFGRGAAGKTIPGWFFGCDEGWREQFFAGYMDADGCAGRSATSVSRCLATGVAILAGTLGRTVSIGRISGKDTAVIAGRMVHQRVAWQVRMLPDDGRYTRLDGVMRWRKLRKAVVAGSVETVVYDIEVEDDHSFLADLFIVHNCQAFSTAGKREKGWGQKKKYEHGASQQNETLFDQYTRLVRGIQPKVFVAENVSGLVKGTAKGHFKLILSALKGCGYAVEARLLDAQWLGVPQQRQRIIFIGVRNDLAASGFAPVFPKPFAYKYSVRDAMVGLWGDDPMCDVIHDEGGRWSEGNISCRPAPNGQSGRAGTMFMQTEPVGGGSPLPPSRQKEDGYQVRDLNPTVTTASPGNDIGLTDEIQPSAKRKFYIAELKRICAFPDDFVLVGTYAQQWERLGNSVPPLMMCAIAETIRDEILLPAKSKGF